MSSCCTTAASLSTHCIVTFLLLYSDGNEPKSALMKLLVSEPHLKISKLATKINYGRLVFSEYCSTHVKSIVSRGQPTVSEVTSCSGLPSTKG